MEWRMRSRHSSGRESILNGNEVMVMVLKEG